MLKTLPLGWIVQVEALIAGIAAVDEAEVCRHKIERGGVGGSFILEKETRYGCIINMIILSFRAGRGKHERPKGCYGGQEPRRLNLVHGRSVEDAHAILNLRIFIYS